MRGPQPLRGLFPPLEKQQQQQEKQGGSGSGSGQRSGGNGGGGRARSPSALSASNNAVSAAAAAAAPSKASRPSIKSSGGGGGGGGGGAAASSGSSGSSTSGSAAPPQQQQQQRATPPTLAPAPATRDRFGFLQQPTNNNSSAPIDTDTIGVIVRVRPLSDREAARGEGVAIEVDEDGKTVLVRIFDIFFSPLRNPNANLNLFSILSAQISLAFFFFFLFSSPDDPFRVFCRNSIDPKPYFLLLFHLLAFDPARPRLPVRGGRGSALCVAGGDVRGGGSGQAPRCRRGGLRRDGAGLRADGVREDVHDVREGRGGGAAGRRFCFFCFFGGGRNGDGGNRNGCFFF